MYGIELILVLMVVAFGTSCGNPGAQTEPMSTEPVQFSVVESKADSVFLPNKDWKSRSYNMGSRVEVKSLYFVDELIGFAIAENSKLYRTADAGKSWTAVESLPSFSLVDLQFVTQDEGYMLSLSPATFNEAPLGSVIHKTIDGGNSWKIHGSFPSVSLYKLEVDVDGSLVVVGRRNVAGPQTDTQNVVFYSRDRGLSWVEKTTNVNTIEVSERGQVADFMTDVLHSRTHGIVALSIKGRLYSSLDNGDSWKLLTKVPEVADDFGVRSLLNFGELSDGSIWVAGGAAAIEGTFGVVAVTKDLKVWDRTTLAGNDLKDVAFLSENEIIACASSGAASRQERGKDRILYSSNRGKSWSTVLVGGGSAAYTSIFMFSASKLMIGGKNGEVVMLDRQ